MNDKDTNKNSQDSNNHEPITINAKDFSIYLTSFLKRFGVAAALTALYFFITHSVDSDGALSEYASLIFKVLCIFMFADIFCPVTSFLFGGKKQFQPDESQTNIKNETEKEIATLDNATDAFGPLVVEVLAGIIYFIFFHSKNAIVFNFYFGTVYTLVPILTYLIFTAGVKIILYLNDTD